MARREPDRVEHGDPARAGGQERRHLRLGVRRLLARRVEEHRLVEERDGRPDRGRLGPPRDAGPHRAERAAGGGKGLVEYGPQTNFPNPWPGGEWRLRDIMDYERIASDAILETAPSAREDLLSNALAKARARSRLERPARPSGSRRPSATRPARALVAALLAEHGVELRRRRFGDVYVPLAQPYGRFVRRCWSRSASPR
jgi:hypothetical protein